MSKKPIIVFEGIEGTGKSHHIKKIVNFLKKKKVNFFTRLIKSINYLIWGDV